MIALSFRQKGPLCVHQRCITTSNRQGEIDFRFVCSWPFCHRHNHIVSTMPHNGNHTRGELLCEMDRAWRRIVSGLESFSKNRTGSASESVFFWHVWVSVTFDPIPDVTQALSRQGYERCHYVTSHSDRCHRIPSIVRWPLWLWLKTESSRRTVTVNKAKKLSTILIL